jgi:hypothetical protein
MFPSACSFYCVGFLCLSLNVSAYMAIFKCRLCFRLRAAVIVLVFSVSLVSGRQVDSRVELLDGWDACYNLRVCVLSESVGQIAWQEFP